MDIVPMQDSKLQEKPKDKAIEKLRKLLKKVYSLTNVDDLLEEAVKLGRMKKRDKEQEKRYTDLFNKIAKYYALDNGMKVSNIPSNDDQQKAISNIRQRLIDEHHCTTAAELILVDQMVAAYWRLMQYEQLANRAPDKEDNGTFSFTQLTINVVKEARSQIEQAHRQINVSLTMLKDLKRPRLKVNVRADSAYFAQNQQVINEKPTDEPPVETIKPK